MYDCCACVSLFILSLIFFFFKQKTAYEMRISDWSSDVCSSDLLFLVIAHDGCARPHAITRAVSVAATVAAYADMRAVIIVSLPNAGLQIGRASCRERVCQYV